MFHKALLLRYSRDDIIKWSVYGIFTVFIFFIHIPWIYIGDDLALLPGTAEYTISDRFVYLYNWNGKILTDLLANILYRIPFISWKAFDTLIYLGIAVLIVKLFTKNTILDVFIVCCLILSFPFYYISTAGYICVSTNYVYPTLCILFVASRIKKALENKKLNVADWITSAIAIIYASNQDQSAMCMIGMLLIITLYALKNRLDKKIYIIFAALLVISVCSYTYMFFLPGHLNRMASTVEMELYLPEFAQWSIGMKIYRGYSSTVSHIMFNGVDIFSIFCLLISLLAFSQNGIVFKIIGSFPIFVMGVIHFFGSGGLIYNAYYQMTDLCHFYEGISGVFALALSIVILLCITVTILRCTHSTKNKWLMMLLLIIAAGSREMMGFSPTIYASAERTFIYMIYALIICCVIIIDDLKRARDNRLLYAGVGVIVTMLI